MFEVPNAKRIKRSELLQRDESPQSRSSSRSTTPLGAQEDESAQNVKPDYGFQYDFINPVSNTSETAAHESQESTKADDDQNQEEQEYQFRLFTSAPQQQSAEQPSQPTKPKIRLSATPPPEDLAESLSLDKASFIRPNRPESYYFTSAVPPRLLEDLKSQYTQVALSTSDVLSRASSTHWPGTVLPWRCIHVELLNPHHHKLSDPSNRKPYVSVSVRATTKQDSSTRSSDAAGKRTRPSKKSRILLRRRLALRAELVAQTLKSDEVERQKRTQRNREKKVKRKEREKRKKLDAVQDAANPGKGRQEEQENISMLDHDSKDDSHITEKHTRTPAPPAPVSGLGDRRRDEKKPPVTSTPKAPTAPRAIDACAKSSTPTKRAAPTARAGRVS